MATLDTLTPSQAWSVRVNGPGGPATLALDPKDLRMLSILEQDGRIAKCNLAAMVDLSPSSCLERLRVLERKKLIVAYHAQINVRALAPHEIIFTEVTLKSHHSHDFSLFERYVNSVSSIVECFALGGGVDYILKMAVKNVGAYQRLIERMLDEKIGIDRYFTYICTKLVKTASRVPMEAVMGSIPDLAD